MVVFISAFMVPGDLHFASKEKKRATPPGARVDGGAMPRAADPVKVSAGLLTGIMIPQGQI
ncbi:hypothetical protein [Sphingomonas phyllosphaerae]|uniref:hypothetical protein n=1 Tax=Sphingomonas phyllosphaerae TaxID=257003 RepID=UPI00138AD327|nr:hypothetical protein [Sphingomonas phyllosphaerae]